MADVWLNAGTVHDKDTMQQAKLYAPCQYALEEKNRLGP